jgi:hypothetical protein
MRLLSGFRPRIRPLVSVSAGILSYVNNSKPIANSGRGGRKQYSFFILQLPQTMMIKKTSHIDCTLTRTQHLEYRILLGFEN